MRSLFVGLEMLVCFGESEKGIAQKSPLGLGGTCRRTVGGEEGFSAKSVPLSPAFSFYTVINGDELAPKTRRRIFDSHRSEEVAWLLLLPISPRSRRFRHRS